VSVSSGVAASASGLPGHEGDAPGPGAAIRAAGAGEPAPVPRGGGSGRTVLDDEGMPARPVFVGVVDRTDLLREGT